MLCAATTKKGEPCRNRARSESLFCARHGAADVQAPKAKLITHDALYYPSIDIPDRTWLMTAALYWNTISTIVPVGLKRFYTAATAKVLHDAEVLVPTRVDPDMPEVVQAGELALRMLPTVEARHLGNEGRNAGHRRVHLDKLSFMLQSKLESRFSDRGRSGTWLKLPTQVAALYMTTLALQLAEGQGRAIVTRSLPADDAVGRAARMAPATPARAETAEGLLATLTLQGLKITESTTAKQIVKFRDKHHSELGRFRKAIRELACAAEGAATMAALQNHVTALHADSVAPAVDELRAKLRENRITVGTAQLKQSLLASASPTIIGACLAATGYGPFALLAGAGVSLVLQGVTMEVERRRLMRDSFAYALLAERKFGKKKRKNRRG